MPKKPTEMKEELIVIGGEAFEQALRDNIKEVAEMSPEEIREVMESEPKFSPETPDDVKEVLLEVRADFKQALGIA